MVFSDGECPNCTAPHLHLNTSDLMECPSCHLVCAPLDGIVATIMPFLGKGKFRLEDCSVAGFQGTAFAKSKEGGVIPDDRTIFRSTNDLKEYVSSLTPSIASQSKHEQLTGSFFQAFRKRIETCDGHSLREAWASRKNRTLFYARDLLPRIAEDLGMMHGTEEFKVDHVVAKLSIREHAVPAIFVESENDFVGATHEIRKLCSINAPLRVLITVTNKQFAPDPAAGAYKQLREWQSIIRSHYELNEDYRGVLAVIVGQEYDGRISFTACAFHRDADLLWPLSRLVSRDVG